MSSGVRAVLFDIGDTLVHAAPPATAVADLAVHLRLDVVEDLAVLRDQGFRLGAVTDTAVMTEGDVRALLAPTGLDELLEVVVTSVDVAAAKPDPTSLRTAIDRLGLVPSEVLFIGDRTIDRDAAAAAGTGFAFVGDTIASTIARWTADPAGGFQRAVNRWHADTNREAECNAAAAAAKARLDELAKPVGSLGRLEDLAVRLASLAGVCPPPPPTPVAVAVFAADHGVHAAGVTPWPQAITAAMAVTMAAGRASINALAQSVGASVTVVDVGIATSLPPTNGLIDRRVMSGTRNLADEPAMTLAEATRALDTGASIASELIEGGARCLVTGEMGIANTTAATALICAFTGRSPTHLVGPGAGSDEPAMVNKKAAITLAVGRHGDADDPLEVLASLGGLEIAAMAGFIVAGTAAGVPVVVDGVIANAALLAASRLVPGVEAGVVAGHRSTEPGATAVFDALALEPLLDLSMRLGEGTGAVLAVPLLVAAAALLTDVATIAEVTGG